MNTALNNDNACIKKRALYVNYLHLHKQDISVVQMKVMTLVTSGKWVCWEIEADPSVLYLNLGTYTYIAFSK